MEQAAQRGWGYPMPGGAQCQVGWGFRQPNLVGGIPDYVRAVAVRWYLRSLPTQEMPQLYDFMNSGMKLLALTISRPHITKTNKGVIIWKSNRYEPKKKRNTDYYRRLIAGIKSIWIFWNFFWILFCLKCELKFLTFSTSVFQKSLFYISLYTPYA